VQDNFTFSLALTFHNTALFPTLAQLMHLTKKICYFLSYNWLCSGREANCWATKFEKYWHSRTDIHPQNSPDSSMLALPSSCRVFSTSELFAGDSIKIPEGTGGHWNSLQALYLSPLIGVSVHNAAMHRCYTTAAAGYRALKIFWFNWKKVNVLSPLFNTTASSSA